MSHSSGIHATESLTQAYIKARTEGTRALKVNIVDESLTETGSIAPVGDDKADWTLVADWFEPAKPCYVLYQLDTDNAYGREWVLLCYVPDNGPVKSKMLYASTRALLKKDLGDTYFSHELHGTEKNDFTCAAFEAHVKGAAAPAPLTESERVSAQESGLELDTGGKSSGVHGVAFPMSGDAQGALAKLKAGEINFVCLKLDTEKETVELDETGQVANDELSTKLGGEPRYMLHKYVHEHNGATQEPIIFVYACADNCKVKLRMLYSTVKAGIMHQLEGAELTLAHKFEVTEADELSTAVIESTLHPVEVEAKKTFAKPTGPGGRPRARPQRKK